MTQATHDGIIGAMILFSWPIAFVAALFALTVFLFSLYYLRFIWVPILRVFFYVVSFVFTWTVFLSSWIFAISGIMYLCGLTGPLPWFWDMYKAFGKFLFFKLTGSFFV